jgi:hypothetical protein
MRIRNHATVYAPGPENKRIMGKNKVPAWTVGRVGPRIALVITVR